MAVNILAIVGITLVVAIVGGGIFYLFWLWTRPKRISWKANVFQLGEGIRPPIKDKRGNIISELTLSDLRPYTKDVLSRIEKAAGETIYELQKLGKVTPAVTSDVVEYWGDKDKIVNCLLIEDSVTLLKKGYDRSAGEIFQPLPHSRINQIKGEIVQRKDRVKEKKDVLQAITPWVVTGISMLALVFIVYIIGSSAVQVSENNKDAAQIVGDALISASEENAKALRGELDPSQVVVEEPPPTISQ